MSAAAAAIARQETVMPSLGGARRQNETT